MLETSGQVPEVSLKLLLEVLCVFEQVKGRGQAFTGARRWVDHEAEWLWEMVLYAGSSERCCSFSVVSVSRKPMC